MGFYTPHFNNARVKHCTYVRRMAPEDFVDLELQHQEKHFRVQRSATLSDKVMRRSALPGMTRPTDPSVLTVDPLSCRPKWKWPEEHATSVPEFWRTRMNDVPQRTWNVVPFRALVYAFVMDADARKIFGTLGLTWLKTEIPSTFCGSLRHCFFLCIQFFSVMATAVVPWQILGHQRITFRL